jgi:hypothetical protein
MLRPHDLILVAVAVMLVALLALAAQAIWG